jgi:AcrR family transcriptional regulator
MADGNRDKIIDAFLALVAEKPVEKVGVAEIAERASLSLVELRREFGTTMEILAAFSARTDEKVLAEGLDAELADAPARERLFDVLMRRIEVLKPHRDAIRSLARSARRDPPLALALNGIALRSASWMLAAAKVEAGGLQGCARAQGLVYVMARAYRVWVDDDDPGLARTMATLDRELANGERALNLFDDLCRFVPRFGGGRRRRRRDSGDETIAA